MKQPLSGLVAKGEYSGHKHNWQKMERNKQGQVFYLHVCTDHTPPLIKAYDVKMMKESK